MDKGQDWIAAILIAAGYHYQHPFMDDSAIGLVQCLRCGCKMDLVGPVARVVYLHSGDPTIIAKYACHCGNTVDVETR